MKIKNFKGQKNYYKNSPRGTVEILSKETRQWRFQKDKLPSFLLKVGGTALFMVGGYFLMSLPGLLVGGILGYQMIKLIAKVFKIKLG